MASYLGRMGYGFFDWLGRVIMLVLAGLITLSIIGAIAAIPSGSPVQTSLGMEPRAWPDPQPATEPQPIPPEPIPPELSPPAPRSEPQAPAAAPPPAATMIPVPPPMPDPIERWLETIAYALLAIAGILAFATLLLWRALRHWRRTADALEASRSAVPR